MLKENKIKVDNRFNLIKDKVIRIDRVSSKSLLNSKRIDICVKYQYIKAISNKFKSSKYLTELYKSTIKYFSDGLYSEPGESNKKSFSDYQNQFLDLYNSIKNDGFNNELGYIPLSRNGVPLDGAHRIAIASLLELDIDVVYLDVDDQVFNCEFFKRKGATEKEIDGYLKCLYDISDRYRVAIIWPYADISDDILQNTYSTSLIYSKRLNLDPNGIRNLCLLSYYNEPWTNGIINAWGGIVNKADPCFKNKETRILFFESESLEIDISKKEYIRDYLDGSKNNLHSTDTYSETKDIVDIVLDENCEFILNNLNRKKLSNIILELTNHSILNNCILTGSSLLALFDIRNNADIDILINDKSISLIDTNIGLHNDYDTLYGQPIENYFIDSFATLSIVGLKLINIDEFICFKRNRNEDKDRKDIEMLYININGNKRDNIKYIINVFNSNVRVFYFRYREKFRNILISIGLLDKIKKIRKLK